MRNILAIIAALALLWLFGAGQGLAQDTQALTCVPGETVPIKGAGPVATGLLLRFGGRIVGGGVSDASGAYRLSLQVGQERPGDYPVVVEVRETRDVLQRLTCTVPGASAPQSGSPRPSTTPGRPSPVPAATTTPGRGSPTPVLAPTVTRAPTVTPNLADFPRETACGTVAAADVTGARNSPVKITALDKENETVTLTNVSGQPVDLDPYRLCSVFAGSEPGQEQADITGTLSAGQPQEFTNQGDEIWRNDGRDDAALFLDGQVVSYLIDQ
jgi:hypothetical protein